MKVLAESVANWLAVGAYTAGSVVLVIGVVFGRSKAVSAGVACAAAGAVAQCLAIALRWVRVGHAPYLGFFEVATLLAATAVVGFLALSVRYRALRVAGVAVVPVALLITGGALLADQRAQAPISSLASAWLAVHVLFANLAFGAYAVSFAIATALLLKESRLGARIFSALERFPSAGDIDALMYRWVGAGFVFQSVMIVSGSIWADRAWGRYWGWDPVETWSLIVWAAYAIYLHFTLTLGWRGRRAAWVAVVALPLSLFSLLGVPLVYHSIHGAYLSL